ncbi:hypothetical protein HWB19_gp133 [Cronobacter phage vB_CsaP_009]|uniref:Uncharacterized protein n=1 Tax=Cronobacter phage vB_CsaP_009 TaxID=2699738 RepID=A0A679FE34_9CAUD|nr:hypothetical protein HWB19_gp133 [Cronobacter phage vB_CsaP_009]BBU72779.1 hypothetical protein [Cronobacter phage vB_CsaP_009]
MPSSPKKFKKVCWQCNSDFESTKKVTRFCSKSCGAKYVSTHRKETVTCPYCNKTVQKQSNNQRMCGSQHCHSLAQVERSYKYLNGNKEAYISLLLKKKDRSGLSLDYILKLYDDQKGMCALSGKEMTFIKIPNSDKVHTNLSIDRIDSSKPYEEGNIQLVCAVTNVMKTTLTMSELYDWCNSIVNCLKG